MRETAVCLYACVHVQLVAAVNVVPRYPVWYMPGMFLCVFCVPIVYTQRTRNPWKGVVRYTLKYNMFNVYMLGCTQYPYHASGAYDIYVYSIRFARDVLHTLCYGRHYVLQFCIMIPLDPTRCMSLWKGVPCRNVTYTSDTR